MPRDSRPTCCQTHSSGCPLALARRGVRSETKWPRHGQTYIDSDVSTSRPAKRLSLFTIQALTPRLPWSSPIPAPGVLALVGLAGHVGTGRRRFPDASPCGIMEVL